MRKVTLLAILAASSSLFLSAQSPLAIPPLITGDTFNLALQAGTRVFVPGYNTPTYGANGTWLGPTLEMWRDHDIDITVQNSLPVSTTIHWHGLHVPSMDDGGPHMVIPAGGTWNPNFKMLNDAGTYWYHPHGEGKTELHVARGLAGFILVRDSAEAALPLPRTYGVDDFPLVIQSKAFDALMQFAIASEDDTVMMVNGTMDPYLDVPAQVVRLRLLNGSSMRSFMIGFTGDHPFQLIGTDGGLLDAPVALTRLRISPGERYEILVDLGGMEGQIIQMMSYSSDMTNGIYGAADVGMGMASIPGYDLNPFNGADFNLLELRVDSATAGAITSIPSALLPLTPWTTPVDTQRTLTFSHLMGDPMNAVMGPFYINGTSFHMDSINIRVPLGNTEIWTLTNNTQIAHPFHIHDVQFYVTEVNGAAPTPIQRGRKDVVLVMPMQSVKFLTRFEDFADEMTPYMYHCHMLHHEDEGMMGSFLVMDTVAIGVDEGEWSDGTIRMSPNPANTTVRLERLDLVDQAAEIQVLDLVGKQMLTHAWLPGITSTQLELGSLPDGLYLVSVVMGEKRFTHRLRVSH